MVGKMRLSDIYYYSIAIAMMAGVQIAYALHINIDQKPNGRIYIGFGSPDLENDCEVEQL